MKKENELLASAYKQALGYYVDESEDVKLKRVKYDENGKRCEEEEYLLPRQTRKYVTPSPSMTMFMLKTTLEKQQQPDGEIRVVFDTGEEWSE